MKSATTATVLVFALIASACVSSLQPLYTAKDLIMDPTLVGTWIDKESDEIWIFSNSEAMKYSLVHIDSDGRRGEYDARLVKIEDHLFLDIVPVKSGFAQNDTYRDRVIAPHTFVHIVSGDSAVHVSYLEPRWLQDHLAENPNAIHHEKVGGEIVLSASPTETQRFVLRHMNTPGAFSQPAELVRKKRGK